MKKVQVTMYEAKNGHKFENEERCIEYEKFLDFAEDLDVVVDKVNDFLSDISNYAKWAEVDNNNKHVCVDAFVTSMFNIKVTINEEDEASEVNGSFSIDGEKWNKFTEQINDEHGTWINVPSEYWGI